MYTATAPSFRTTATAVAASMLGTALIFAAPQAAQASPKSDFVRNVEAQLKTEAYAPADLSGVATIAVRIDADGKVLSADVAGSSGHKLLDDDALLTAKSVVFPKGAARTVAVVMKYGNVAKPGEAQSVALVNRYVNAKGEALAQNPASPVG
ncbi:energy transducer TonB [Sphingomonas sp. SUN039]|uniref:energy transducer TonB n=1 Tax=Sphingomonas sp. SUN039 TaxID=2937787 RepID=UPI0021646745|nr:energy transducer TonB [Sphingomonas sp. SUN039]UVO53830.1 energy transducer TonB [Sphingomonas sp. SUN039]